MEHHHISAQHLSIDRIREILVRRPAAGTERRCPDSHRPLPRIPRPQDGKPRTAGLRHHHRIRFVVRHFGGLRRAGAVAEEPRDVARLRYRRASAFRGREADPAAQDPVAILRPFGRAACDRGAADRLFQQRRPARGLPAGFAGRIGRPGAAGPHEPAAAGAGRSGIQGGCAPGCRRAGGAGVAADRARVQGGAGAAQRYAVHERLRRLVFDPVPPPERVGRPHRGAVARRFRRAHRAFLRRGAPDPRPPRASSPRHATSGACWKAASWPHAPRNTYRIPIRSAASPRCTGLRRTPSTMSRAC